MVRGAASMTKRRQGFGRLAMLGHPPSYQQQQAQQQQHQQPAPSAPPSGPANANPPPPPAAQEHAVNGIHASHPPPPATGGTFQTLRLRDEPPPVTQPAPRSRKRKSPPSTNTEPAHPPPPPPVPAMHPGPPPSMQHTLPPPHALMQPPPPHLGPPMPYQYAPTDYTPGGMPPPHPQGPPPPHPGPMPEQQPQSQQAGGGRTLSQSKRAEQNRKAQRAFRERRDQHVKALESRSQLLDAALASADEANRRWEECRALVDQLRIENTQLRATIAALQAGQPANPPNSIPLLNGAPQPPANNASQEGENRSNGAETTTEGGEKRD